MKIKRISLWHVPLTSHEAYHMADGKTCDTVETVMLALESDTALPHLAASAAPARLLNTCDLSGYVAPRLALDAPTRMNGRIAPPEGPGLGVAPDRDLLGPPDLVID